MIRRATLTQSGSDSRLPVLPFGGREMPMPYGWGTGSGIQLTASVIGENDVLKGSIDQSADDTTNAVSIRQFFKRVTGVATTEAYRRRHPDPDPPPDPGDAAGGGSDPDLPGAGSRSHCGLSSRVKPKPAPCTPWKSTASCR
ncbi:alpha-D-ribose 1-methylphosphonate 5-phosphate C-P-lyase PhnJ [Klebsiella pneumoniae subsp. pneumoniae]|nr:alpha-D-ribose 1-methylphosphonate 5-phosphate C-P-lyase PhnJ [Klebsiella pneumoniae subsp. pneumoniae]